MTAALGLMLVSLNASALKVEARSFRICLLQDAGTKVCTTGSIWWASEGDLDQSISPCDYSGIGTCERWQPTGHDTANGYGVNWTCCMELDSGETSPLYSFQNYDIWKEAWTAADVTQLVGNDGFRCTDANYIIQGRTYNGGSIWTYDDQVARCGASAYSGSTQIVKVIEYWMD